MAHNYLYLFLGVLVLFLLVRISVSSPVPVSGDAEVVKAREPEAAPEPDAGAGTSTGSDVAPAKRLAQPWKEYLEAEKREENPWLKWKPRADDPSDKPWLAARDPNQKRNKDIEMMGGYARRLRG